MWDFGKFEHDGFPVKDYNTGLENFGLGFGTLSKAPGSFQGSSTGILKVLLRGLKQTV